jgi:branched-subunit amino acid ABC-type transport system permease component
MLASWLPSDMSNFKDAYVFLLVIIVLIIRPSGLLVRGGTVRT